MIPAVVEFERHSAVSSSRAPIAVTESVLLVNELSELLAAGMELSLMSVMLAVKSSICLFTFCK